MGESMKTTVYAFLIAGLLALPGLAWAQAQPSQAPVRQLERGVARNLELKRGFDRRAQAAPRQRERAAAPAGAPAGADVSTSLEAPPAGPRTRPRRTGPAG